MYVIGLIQTLFQLRLICLKKGIWPVTNECCGRWH